MVVTLGKDLFLRSYLSHQHLTIEQAKWHRSLGSSSMWIVQNRLVARKIESCTVCERTWQFMLDHPNAPHECMDWRELGRYLGKVDRWDRDKKATYEEMEEYTRRINECECCTRKFEYYLSVMDSFGSHPETDEVYDNLECGCEWTLGYFVVVFEGFPGEGFDS